MGVGHHVAKPAAHFCDWTIQKKEGSPIKMANHRNVTPPLLPQNDQTLEIKY